MNTFPRLYFWMTVAVLACTTSAMAEVITAAPSHYTLKHKAPSSMPPSELWDRLTQPASWWHPDHTYSGDAANLTLRLEVGGLWEENWNGSSVLHGTVLHVVPGSKLQINAPFGPLKDIGVTVIWTIDIEAKGTGSMVTFTEVANGSNYSKLDELSGAVDYVKAEAIRRLTVTN